MENVTFTDRMNVDYSVVEKIGFNPYYPEIQSALDDPLVINGKPFIDLASNNYLGLANDPRLCETAKAAIDKYGISMCGTPIASGYSDLFRKVEILLSEFLGLEKTLIYPSCYQANNGLFTAIMKDDDVALVDRCAHSSLMEGIKATGCKIRPFLHNNLDHLEMQLKKVDPASQSFVVTESVFSTEGSIAPFRDIYEMCLRFSAIPVIDDSHGIGVLGESGRGILEHASIPEYRGYYTASLGKALGNMGGIISGPEEYVGYLKYFSSHLVYSTAIPPSVLAGIGKVIEIISHEFHTLSRKMWNYRDMITRACFESGWSLTDSITPITSLKGGDSGNTLRIAKMMYEKGILTTPFIYPSVGKNDGRIRLIAGANLKEESIEAVTSILRNLKNR